MRWKNIPEWRESNFRGHYLTGTALRQWLASVESREYKFSSSISKHGFFTLSWSHHTILQAAEGAEGSDAVELLGRHLQYPVEFSATSVISNW